MFNQMIYQIGLFFRNNKIKKNLIFLLDSQHWTLEQYKQYQSNELKKLIQLAFDKSPYYRSLFLSAGIRPEDIKSIDNLSLIPITSKSNLLKKNKDIQITITTEKSFYSETSGSSGEPLVFYRNQDWDAWHNASVFRGYTWHNIKPWDRNGYLWGFNYSFKKTFITNIQDYLQNRFRLFTYEDKELEHFCHKLKKAKYLNGYSSMIYELAKYVEKNKFLVRDINLLMVKGTSEKIFDSYQKTVLNAFGVKMISEYGSAEAGIIAFECPKGNMHVNMETVIVEEENGEILITNLKSNSFPIVRYQLGDYITLDKDSKCPCGRKSYIIKDITGRVGKNIYGFKNIYPSLTLYYIFKNIAINHAIVLNYQVIQKIKGKIEIKLEKALTEEEKVFLSEEIIKYFKNDIDYIVVENQQLISKKGKKKDFISELLER